MAVLLSLIISITLCLSSNIQPLDAVHEELIISQNTTIETFKVGNEAISRDHLDKWHDVMYLLHDDVTLPIDGDVISWHVYANRTGNITFLVWRQVINNRTDTFALIGYNNFTISRTGDITFIVPANHRIAMARGDQIGYYFAGFDPIPFTKAKARCSSKMMYIERPCSFARCRHYVFRKKQSGWNPCRVHSLYAEVINSSDSSILRMDNANGTQEAVTSQDQELPGVRTPREPAVLRVRLVHGRRVGEGLVLVQALDINDSRVGTVCDDGWDDADATVVCRMLGHRAGYAKFSPFFGHGNDSLPTLLDDLQCNGTEATLSDCRRTTAWGQHNCNHREDVGVSCFTTDNVSHHVFGYPAVPRFHMETVRAGVVIPHPHHRLPWASGTIRSWDLYSQAPLPVNLTLQVWRQINGYEYQLVGQNRLFDITHGSHHVDVPSSERIHFEAGDVIGIYFRSYNPLPYDVSGACRLGEREMYRAGTLQGDVSPGYVVKFHERPLHWRACRLYSLHLTYDGSERYGSHQFAFGHSQYQIITGHNLSREDADGACADIMGDGASLAHVRSQDEFSMVNGELNAMNINRDVELWMGGYAWQEEVYRNWADCQPEHGKECLVLSRGQKGDTYSDDVYHMYTRRCQEKHIFICERFSQAHIEHVSHTTHMPPPPPPLVERRDYVIVGRHTSRAAPFVSKTLVAAGGLDSGATVAVVVVVCVSISLSVCAAIIMYRRRRNGRRCPNDISESSVRFVSLTDKPPI